MFKLFIASLLSVLLTQSSFANGIGKKSDYFFQCRVSYSTKAKISSIVSEEKLRELLVSDFEKKIVYNWDFAGTSKSVSRNIVDRVIEGSNCKAYVNEYDISAGCAAARDGNDYEIICDKESLGEVVQVKR